MWKRLTNISLLVSLWLDLHDNILPLSTGPFQTHDESTTVVPPQLPSAVSQDQPFNSVSTTNVLRTLHDQPISPPLTIEQPTGTLSHSYSSGDLRPTEISDIISRSQNMMSRLGITEKSTFTQERDKIRCELQWVFTDERGSPKIAEAFGSGTSKKASLAHARTTLLAQLGVEEVVSNPERASARKIRELILSHDLSAAAQQSIDFIYTSSTEAWRLFLPQLWKSLLASYQTIHVENFIRAIDRAATHRMSIFLFDSY